jgi:hypothetical protein
VSVTVEQRTDPDSLRAAMAHGRRQLLLIIVCGAASLLLMVCSWAITRGRTTVFAILVVLLLLFAIQLAASLRLHHSVAKAVGIAFTVALVFFAVFGVAYAEYADFAHNEGVFETDRVGEAFFLATTLGTGTGFAPDVGPRMGLLVIAHLQLVVLALGVALTAASGLGRLAVQRSRTTRHLNEASARASADPDGGTGMFLREGDPPPGPG